MNRHHLHHRVFACWLGISTVFLAPFASADEVDSRIQKITNIESSYPSWSPDGSQIVFQSDRNSSFNSYQPDIFIMNADGSGVSQLTDNDAVNLTPSWSPDGKRIVYQQERDGDRELYVMNIDGSSRVNVTNHPAEDSHPKWSADGKHIIFDSTRSGNDELYIMDTDGSNVERVTDDPSIDSYSSLSPDGNRIVWRRRFLDPATESGYGNSEVFAMNRDGTAVTNLTKHRAYDGWPSWSPDGKRIAFASDREQGQVWHIYTMDADGKNVRRVSEQDPGGGYFTKPIWAPDGGSILCTRTKDGNVEIFIIHL